MDYAELRAEAERWIEATPTPPLGPSSGAARPARRRGGRPGRSIQRDARVRHRRPPGRPRRRAQPHEPRRRRAGDVGARAGDPGERPGRAVARRGRGRRRAPAEPRALRGHRGDPRRRGAAGGALPRAGAHAARRLRGEDAPRRRGSRGHRESQPARVQRLQGLLGERCADRAARRRADRRRHPSRAARSRRPSRSRGRGPRAR